MILAYCCLMPCWWERHWPNPVRYQADLFRRCYRLVLAMLRHCWCWHLHLVMWMMFHVHLLMWAMIHFSRYPFAHVPYHPWSIVHADGLSAFQAFAVLGTFRFAGCNRKNQHGQSTLPELDNVLHWFDHHIIGFCRTNPKFIYWLQVGIGFDHRHSQHRHF